MALNAQPDLLQPLSDHESSDNTTAESVALEIPQPAEVLDSTRKLDWNALRQESLRPGGFRSRRAALWPRLLGVEDEAEGPQEPASSTTSDNEEHPDERQIKLDTDRSFVLYPVEPRGDRESLQESLHELLVALFRKRRRLGYFQGYHDIITVIYLTVPPRLRFACAEKMSLHRVRDSMGSGLEPVLGLLRVTRNLLRLADKPFSESLERNSPLPFYALSNLLTLFSHDMPTLNLIQHVFDYLLCRPPIAVVYLTTVAILSRKEEVLALELEGEEGMAHSLLSTLPDLVDEEEAEERYEDDIVEGITSSPTDEHPSQQPLSPVLETDSAPSDSDPRPSESILQDPDPFSSRARKRYASESPLRGTSTSRSRSARRGRDYQGSSNNTPDAPIPSLPHTSPLHSRSPSQVKSAPSPPPPPAYMTEMERMHSKKPTISLSSLLIQADDLRERFPPDHPELALDKVMGPQSVIYTWKEPDTTENILDGLNDTLDPDDEAETILLHPELIVYPYDPVSEAEQSKEDADGDDGDESEEKQGGKRKPRKLLKPRRPLDVKTKTIVTGAVIVLAVAMAAYGIRGGNGGGIFYRLGAVGQGHRKNHHWFGGALAGAAVKFANLFGGENGRGEL
ncbi:rab-GTPase-TBC domain-containing protein [Coprinopsis sp. MPI-PUGE-AT-0042]|nr:rab-GTPase-TBC domain-containing protein [Coprinopsis sp. MPI-PUGE-AT-0042]